MKAVDILELAQPIIEKLLKVDVNPKDIQYLDLYRDYSRLKNEGHKITWIHNVLSEEHDVSIRNIKYIVKRLEAKV